jgi:hypothetical protein
MNQQEVNIQEAVEDLTVSEAGASDVKGGAQVDYFLKLKGIDGEATDARADSGYDLQSK